MKRMKHWGWGFEGAAETPPGIVRDLEETFASMFGLAQFHPRPVPVLDESIAPPSRVSIPASLSDFCTTSAVERLRHSVGRSFLDYATIFSNSYLNVTDAVAFVRSEQDIVAILEWAEAGNLAVIPFGGGTSTSGGIEPAVGSSYSGVVTVNMRALNKLLVVDTHSRSALIQAGATGNEIEASLKAHDLSLRHYPQSLQHSTLGGWIATRSAGHFATLQTRIDDYVENMRVVTPRGIVETNLFPPDGAGPDPDRLFLGSEGGLGLITQAWMRVQRRPKHRASIAVFFDDFPSGSEACRAIAQTRLFPSNLRIIDAEEARINRVSDKGKSILFLGFESADEPVRPAMTTALDICRDHAGVFDISVLDDPRSNMKAEQGRWRDIFVETGYYREILTPREIIYGIVETSVTWERFPALYKAVNEAIHAAMIEATGMPGSLSCRFSYVYPEGPAPYWSFYCRGRHGDLKAQWKHVKTAATDAFLALGGSVTHHTSIGRDHMPWYERQTPPLFREVLGATKRLIDPSAIMNPGVVYPPRS